VYIHIYTQCSDDRYPEFKIFISELILGSFEYGSVAYVTMHCMIDRN